ncbi:MAG TPA: glycosyltransferase family A protein, partial [Chthoniobacterales bacterium]|nr:glycosyltransferase family A protein [Chthoniobacterales bacterium]
MPTAVPIFVISRNRALYLWASLDSLYKYTKYPHHFVFGDNGSDEPLVHQVIEGFSRRGMFSRTLLREENDPDLLEILLEQNQDLLGSYFVFVESDVMVFPQDPCWLTRFVQLMDADPALAMLGAFIDQTDFVDPARARELASELSESQLEFLIKAKSPERNLSKAGKKVITPDSTC